MAIPVSKTLAEIRESIYSRIEAKQDEYAAAGYLPTRLNLNKGVARGILEIVAWVIYQLYLALAAILEQAFPSSATGDWLDLHCEGVDITRKSATKATGAVVFTGEESGNIRIPAGTIVRTPTDGAGNVYRYATTADVVLPDGATTISAEVEAEEYGAASNAVADQITVLVTSVTGVTAVTNASDWLTSEGADEETDEALQERYQLAWQADNGVRAAAYKSWALSVDGVIAVTVLDQHPRGQGTVDVVLKGSAGLPTDALVESVAEVIEAKRPINDDVDVRGPDGVDVDIEAELELVSGDADTIKATVLARIQAVFEDPNEVDGVEPLQIGEDLTLDRLAYVIMAVNGVKRINWTNPTADVEVAADALAVLSSITLTTAWAEEA
ncbi:MAG: hypothetical protein PWQ57_919 [Desulfovibrionales bacterium]|nr:hypothetical protein [Desulfovibrionales bacterium]